MHLAQLNLAHAIAEIDDPIMADFVNNVDHINALSDTSDGFIWRLEVDDSGESNGAAVFGSTMMLVNMSVWKDRDSLFNFVYNSMHVDILKRKKEWFQKMPKMHMVLWHIEEGHIPTLEEAKERLEYLQVHGESPYAFSFKSNY